MALVSPGVQVTVIDESFYTPAEPGTTPLIVIATGQDKLNGSGTGTAQGTLKANAGKAFRMTSQRDVVDFFGVPFFEKTPGNSPIHGSERNEYGLLAAYSFMGVSSSAFIVRADIDLNQLQGQSTAPGDEPVDGAWWVDTNDTIYGIQEWNNSAPSVAGGQKFAVKTPLILTNDESAKLEQDNVYGVNKPKKSVGSIGDYAIVFQSGSANVERATLWYKSAGNEGATVQPGDWVLVGSNEWKSSHPVFMAVSPYAGFEDETIIINGSVITLSSSLATTVARINNPADGPTGVTARAVNGRLYIYSDGANAGDDSANSDRVVITEVNATNGTLKDIGLVPQDSTVVTLTGFSPALHIAPHTNVPQWKATGVGQRNRPTGSVWIKTTEPGNGARWRVRRWNSANQAWVAVDAPIYLNGQEALYYLDRSGGGSNIPVDSIYVQANATEDEFRIGANDELEDSPESSPAYAQFRVFRRKTTSNTSITSSVISDSTFTENAEYSFTIKQSIPGSANLTAATTISFVGDDGETGSGIVDAEEVASRINSAVFLDESGNLVSSYVRASISSDNRVIIEHLSSGDIRFTNGVGNPLNLMFSVSTTANYYAAPSGSLDDFIASNWEPLSTVGFSAQNSQPLEEPFDGQLWYNPEFSQVDIMVHDGNTWRGYNNVVDGADPAGPRVSATAPATQSDGTPLVQGDLWISTADLENFPTIYRWDDQLLEWILIDKTDQITDEGVLFADARFGTSGATGNTAAPISEMILSDYLDPDAPDPALYPKGMLLWNLRRSGGNVKIYRNSYIDSGADNVRFGNESMANYANELSEKDAAKVYDRWTTFSANNEDGSGSFGRKAQRKVVVAAMKSVIDTSQEIRDEERRNFNLIAAPQYPECLSNLINLNIDRGLTAFVIGDTPLRLKSDATSLINWGTNANLVFDNGDDGIVSFDEYCAVYYPNGFTTDLGGSNAVVPASHMMLRTIALSDQVSYPWFAPAGTRRGGITNATAVGYIDSLSGEFQTVALNEGTRDVLYDLKVNPIPFFVGVGLVAYGQKTRARNASALDRINVARLVVYLRSQLQKLARPYIFEPNDQITRDEIKGAVESLLLELVGLRALYDFAVVCDESNNTPSRIDRNELYVDIAIEPVKAVEFIYIPLRIKNTGEI